MQTTWGVRYMLSLCLLLTVGCGLKPRSTALEAATVDVQSVSVTTIHVSREPDGTVLQRVEADLDNDGTLERAIAHQAAAEVRIVIEEVSGTGRAWYTSLPAGTAFAGLRVQDMDGDGRNEVLIEGSRSAQHMYSLGVIRWLAGQARFLAPEGGPSQGSQYFHSLYYPPWVDDFMGDGVFEIVVSASSTDPVFLDSVVYQLDGEAYRVTELYLVPPRRMPTTLTP